MTDLSKFKVADAFKHLDPNQGMADGISAGFPSVRYRGKAWTLSYGGKNYPFKREDDGSPLTYIDMIILGVSPGLSKAYFGQDAWTEESAGGPICYSLKGDVPEPGVPIPQAKSCGICSHNEWITKPTGGRGKECQDHKRMAILLMPTMTKKMLGAPLVEPVHLKIPPASLKSLKKYSDELQHEGIPFAAVVTRVAFSPERIFEMTFETVQALTNKEADVVLPLMQDTQTRAIMGSTPEVRQVAPPPVQEKVETGLMEAFGKPAGNGQTVAAPAPKPRGRPAGTPNKPKAEALILEHDSPPAQRAEVASSAGGDDTPWEESDTDLDSTVNKLLGDKLSKMLK